MTDQSFPHFEESSPHGGQFDEDKFERIVVPNERETAPENFRLAKQIDCFQYESEHDIPDKRMYKSCTKNYLMNDSKATVLFAMIIGFKDYDKLVEEEPFSLCTKKSITAVYQPTNSCLVDEINRRSHFFFKEFPNHEDSNHPLWTARSKKAKMPRPKQWSRPACMEWLSKNTKGVFRLPDEEFLTTELERIKAIVSEAIAADAARQQMAATSRKDQSTSTTRSSANATGRLVNATSWSSRSGWSALPPNLRLIEIVLLPDLRQLFVTRENTLGRTELDARGTEHEKITFWEKVQEIFNDESWTIESSCSTSREYR